MFRYIYLERAGIGGQTPAQRARVLTDHVPGDTKQVVLCHRRRSHELERPLEKRGRRP